MTVPDLIQEVLNLLRNQWYADRVREFKRDERALLKAVARYGYVCAQRGWLFEPEFIFRELAALLTKIKTSGAEIGYLPVYLEGAVDRHVRLRAEELNEQAKLAKAPGRLAGKVVAATAVVPVVIEKSGAETLAVLYQDLKRAARVRRQRPARKPGQGVLL